MKIETASMLSYENRNCMYAQLMKVETTSIGYVVNRKLQVGRRYESRNCKYAKL